jgi:hypothetical protein
MNNFSGRILIMVTAKGAFLFTGIQHITSTVSYMLHLLRYVQAMDREGRKKG